MSAKSDVLSRLDDYKKEVSGSLDKLLNETIPLEILDLNKLLDSDELSLSKVEEIHAGPEIEPLLPGRSAGTSCNAKEVPVDMNDITNRFLTWNMLHVALPPGGRIECNKHIVELYKKTMKLEFEFMQNTSKMVAAILFLTPKVEDGNNFGVEVQEETVKNIKEKQKSLKDTWKDFSFNGYFKDRASCASDLCEHPHLDDYKEALKRLDENYFLFLIEVIAAIRDSYANIHDIIEKNIEKIKKPRTSRANDLF